MVIDPATHTVVDYRSEDNLPSPYLSFVLVIHRGKLLLEVATDWNDHTTRTRLTSHVAGLYSSPELEFLHAIHASVGDPAAKLIYADWLEERGDARSQLLRTEAAAQAGKDVRLRMASESDGGELLHNGYIPPDDLQWFWRWLADIPDLTPERRHR